MKRISFSVYPAILIAILGIMMFSCSTGKNNKGTFTDHLPDGVQRVWLGPDYWANPLQDWRLNHGRIECVAAARNRNVNILTHRVDDVKDGFHISVKTGLLTDTLPASKNNWIGIRVGAKGQFHDYRDDAIYGKGLNIGITTKGELFTGEPPVKVDKNAVLLVPYLKKGILLEIDLTKPDGKYYMTVTAKDPTTGKELATVEQEDVPAQNVTGSLALVSHFGDYKRKKAVPACWFDDLRLSGTGVSAYPERAFGPILFAQYTLNKKILKLAAQMPPLGEQDGHNVTLQIQEEGKWKNLATEEIDPDARTATFRIENWDDSRDIPYRLTYSLAVDKSKSKEYYYTGTIRKDPRNKEKIVVAAFTGNSDVGFPNTEVTEAVKKINPDLLFFSGDQIYEVVGGYGVQRSPVDKAILDYLRKWYLYGWEYGELLRNIPTVAIPDDHDVFHGNLWGAGGKATPPGLTGMDAQDAGGYKMPPRWVNMVQRTQTSHLPDPYDPTPVDQGITVYYTALNVGGVSFAIVEDRKFKSAPKPLLPKAKIRNGWPQNPDFNAAKEADIPGAVLLGSRQLKFLNEWNRDWSDGTWMKVLLSQTIFENLATLPKEDNSDATVPRLRIMKKGEYPPDDVPVSDFDSDGWPQTGRRKAVDAIRKAFAMHIAGDQHLGSTTQYGLDDWRDASYAFCVPSISNFWPRRWFPVKGGLHRAPGAPKYTGDFFDGFGNRMTVWAVANPTYTGRKPSKIYDRSSGYGIVTFDRNSRQIKIDCWPRGIDPTAGDEGQYPGWPVVINQQDNYNPPARAWLPKIEVSGMENPVIKVFGEDNELVYALRIRGNTFTPKVYKEGIYSLLIGDEGRFKKYEGLKASKTKDAGVLKVEL